MTAAAAADATGHGSAQAAAAEAAVAPAPTPASPPVWVIHCDGSALPNPGRMGLGAVVVGPGGTPRHELSEAAAGTGCNNEAELRALHRALQWLAAQTPPEATAVQVFSDSSVLVAQLAPRPQRAAPALARLAPLCDDVRCALQRFAQADLLWLPRHRNGAADALARAALGLAPKAEKVAGRKRHTRHKR